MSPVPHLHLLAVAPHFGSSEQNTTVPDRNLASYEQQAGNTQNNIKGMECAT